MASKCPSCKRDIIETGWMMEEIDFDHHRGIIGKVIYCNNCQAILAIFQM